MMRLNDLPREVLELIVQDNLSPNDLQRLSETNSTLRGYLREHSIFIWKVLITRDFPYFEPKDFLQQNDQSALRSVYFQLRKSSHFMQLLVDGARIPTNNPFARIMLNAVSAQFVSKLSLPLNSLFEDPPPSVVLDCLTCSTLIDRYFNRLPLDVRVVLSEEQKVLLRPILTTFFRSHLPMFSLIPIMRNNKYIVTRFTIRLLPEELRKGLYFHQIY